MKRFTMLIFSASLFSTCSLCAQSSFQNVTRWAYQLQDMNIAQIAADDSFQVMVTDYSHDGSDANKLSVGEVDSIKNSGKTAISYISIGEAEDYRWYWDSTWYTSAPVWLDSVDPDWPGDYKVRYWDTTWQKIVYTYLDTIIAQGFNGIYLDIIDGWYYWQSEVDSERQVPAADSLMIDFVLKIRSHVSTVSGNANFILIPQNGEDLIFQPNITLPQQTQYYNAVTAIGIEDVFFNGPNQVDNPYAPDTYRLSNIQLYQAQGKKVFNIEYITTPANLTKYQDTAAAYGFVPYACVPALDVLCGAIPTGIHNLAVDRGFEVFPNPVGSSTLSVSFSEPVNSSMNLRLFDITGKVIELAPASVHITDSGFEVEIPAGLANGFYWLEADGAQGQYAVKLVLMR